MTFALTLVLVLHLLSWAYVFGGAIVSLRQPVLAKGMVHAVVSALVTGALMVGLQEMLDFNLNHMLVGIKILVALVIGFLVIWGSRNPERVSTGLLGGIAGLTALNVVFGVLL